jgi:DNA repair ATPase RecN
MLKTVVDSERIDEIARMINGAKITEVTRRAAREMLARQE